jgi:hypothetical protein
MGLTKSTVGGDEVLPRKNERVVYWTRVCLRVKCWFLRISGELKSIDVGKRDAGKHEGKIW